jgi:cytochrome c2
MKGADFVRDKEKLHGFIAKPDEVVPGANCVIVFDRRRSETIL